MSFNILPRAVAWLCCALLALPLAAQEETSCNPTEGLPATQGQVNINYGSTTNAFSFTSRSDYTVGQPLVGRANGPTSISEYGFWARFLLPPQAPFLRATQGEFNDRILLVWNEDPLSASATSGYVIKRDGAFLAQLEPGTQQFIDFNVQAGELYEYSVTGRNEFGNGIPGNDVGFINPNGVVTGRITTRSGNPVGGAIVTLDPSTGRSLAFDGLDDYLCASFDDALPTNQFTVSTWLKVGDGNDRGTVIDMGKDINKNFWMTTQAVGADKGIVVGVGDGTTPHEVEVPFLRDEDGWHHVAAVYSGDMLIVYVDSTYRAAMHAPIANEAALFNIGTDRAGDNYFGGLLDDVRIYDRPLTQTEIILGHDITASNGTPGLVAYWKFDEGVGRKVFDVAGNDIDATVEGATFSDDTPDILTAGTTDVGGYYTIAGVNYSGQETFQARPRKNFYRHNSIEFNAAFGGYANLPAIELHDSATIEIVVQPFDLASRQTLLSNGPGFELFLEDAQFFLSVNGEAKALGAATSDFQYLTLVLDGGNDQVSFYRNTTLVSTVDFGDLSPAATPTSWQLAASGGETPANFYTGLIDEVAFFDSLLTINEVQLHASPLIGEGIESGVGVGDPRLKAYFPLDEGEGTSLEDYGPNLYADGTLQNASFSIIAFRQLITKHLFRPSERVVNLNLSVTAVGNIDFIDESTVQIIGVVRFSNTFCFQDSVEMLVNGNRAFPPIFTDSVGRYVADFEPGSNVVLTPRYRDSTHQFFPGFFEARRINRPIAGILFQNTTKRTIEGQVAGGSCRLSINDTENPIELKAASLNGCYEQTIRLTEASGKYKFNKLPPIPLRVSVVRHNNPVIAEFFQVAGGSETDLRAKRRDTLDFIYTAPPNVEIEQFEPGNDCDIAFLRQSSPKNGWRQDSNRIRVFEQYLGGKCYLDSFSLTINNQVADADPVTVEVTDTTEYYLKYRAGVPNFAGNRLKLINVIGRNRTGSAEGVTSVVVLGERAREATFTTTSPAFPLIVLRDPPGDASSSTLASNTTTCRQLSNAVLTNETNTGSVSVDVAPNATTFAGAGVGAFTGTIVSSDNTAATEIGATVTSNSTVTSTAELCVTNSEAYSTSAEDDIIGEDADIFVGAALNVEISSTDVLDFDFDSCEFTESRNNRVWPQSFGTRYFYSRWQIETDIIPTLLEDVGDTLSARAWQNILDLNQEAKDSATLRDNYSFDGLATRTESQRNSATNSTTMEFEFNVTSEFGTVVGTEILGVGSTIKMGINLGGGTTTTNGNATTEATEVSFTLADDDPNDNFTVDVLDDGVFSTPVFKLRAGESLCPWEPGTRNREEVGFNIDKLSEINVPENAPAVFRLQLTNEGQTGNDPIVYVLGTVEGSNPDGAVIRVDGAPLVSPRSFQILPDETIDLTLTVNRGPVAFDYDSLGIFMASECMLAQSRGLGYDLSNTGGGFDPDTGDPLTEGPYDSEDLAKFYKEFRINVEFIEPCTPIDITVPMENWVVTPDQNERLSVTLSGYDNEDPDLDTVRLQYRPTGGDGSWINIQELPASAFATDPVFKVLTWDMTELRDGPYEIRATATCSDLSLAAGISGVVPGRKETLPPALLGTPQPADGVLNPGDEISITFTKRIQCDLVFQADGANTGINYNNLALIDKQSGELIDATISCSDDKIIIVPNIANQFIENRTLEVITEDIQDFYGNGSERIAWEFFVNRSNLYWAGGRIDEVTPEGDELVVTREIQNQSGQITSYEIPSVPDWMGVFPRSGTLDPGARRTVTFTFPANLLADAYSTTLIMETIDGEEPLEMDLRVTCEGPDWAVNPAAYDASMNLTVELDIEGELSTDRVDQIAAFYNGELRGVANIERIDVLSTGETTNPNLAFLTVYGNDGETDSLTFQVWDASECALYGTTRESFRFAANGTIGEPLLPQTIHTAGELLRKIQLQPGWNWISYNLDLPDNGTDATLASLTNATAGDLIKSQTAFSQYTTSVNRWLGSLDTTDYRPMYQLRLANADSLTLLGAPVDPTTPIAIRAGWNWIGYLPTRGLPVTTALNSLTPLNGDIVKSQTSFAQYVAGVGWLGNLRFMSSPNGYLLRLTDSDTLRYPERVERPGIMGELPFEDVAGKSLFDTLPSHWSVDPSKFEHSMNVVAILLADDTNVLKDGDEIAAFVGDSLRGANRVIHLPEIDELVYLVFLTVYGNEEGEVLTYRYYNGTEEEEMDINEEETFVINDILGTVGSPRVLTLSTTATGNIPVAAEDFRIYPNPARDQVHFEFSARPGQSLELTVTDALGRQVARIAEDAPGYVNTLAWDASRLPVGVYFVSLRRADSVKTLRLELQR